MAEKTQTCDEALAAFQRIQSVPLTASERTCFECGWEERDGEVAALEERIRVLEAPLKCGHPGACLTMGPVLQFDEIDVLNVEKSTYCIVCHAQAHIERVKGLAARRCSCHCIACKENRDKLLAALDGETEEWE